MRLLPSYQNTTPECNGVGKSYGQDGITIDILEPNKDELMGYLTVDRIATAASRMVRYRGEHRMTNAQHCVRGADAFLLQGEIELAYAFLFHDALETVMGDISRPVKYLPGVKEVVKPLENKLESIFFEEMGIAYPLDPKIKIMDLNSGQEEMYDMKHGYSYPDVWDEAQSYNNFMGMYKKLQVYRSCYKNRPIV